MNTLRFLIALLASCGAASALACDYPPLVTIPTGEDATKEEMLTAQTGVKDYMAAMQVYLDCIAEELTAAGDDAPGEYKSVMFSRHNAAVAEMEAIAASFNGELQAFNEGNAEPDDG